MFGCGMILNRSDGVDLNAFYPVRPECNDDARKTRFKVKVDFAHVFALYGLCVFMGKTMIVNYFEEGL